MSPLRCRSFAKVNLYLQVVGRRSDGYHELRTIFQSIDLHDEIEVELADRGVELEVTDPELPSGPDNLAHRAAAAALERWGKGRGCQIRLRKRVPVAAGLGGGSSNAATVLLALRDLLGVDGDRDGLLGLAADLGADVPFFLHGGTALGIGRGDEIVPMPQLAGTELWIVVPPVTVSTAEVYSALGDLTPGPLLSSILAVIQGLAPVSVETLAKRNDLERVVMDRFPEVATAKQALSDAGAHLVQLSGSGSALFAVFPAGVDVDRLRGVLPSGTRFYPVRTLSQRQVNARRTAT